MRQTTRETMEYINGVILIVLLITAFCLRDEILIRLFT